jgi:two-component system sensor histidine kinase MprB
VSHERGLCQRGGDVSLRRRIAGAAALAVAAVAVTMGVTGYLSTRSHLVGELQQELRQRAQPFLGEGRGHPAGGGRQDGGGGPGDSGGHVGDSMPPMPVPPPPALGGAPGYFQFVQPDGTAVAQGGGAAKLPVDARVIEIARRARGSFFTTARVHGVHLQVLTVGDPHHHDAVQVALPLTGVDSVLSGLLLPYGLLIGGGVLLAALFGLAISKSALAPIERFLSRTELVTGSLSRPGRPPARLEEHGASELRRLAQSFNRTLDALERSIDAQRQLIADASHELRTPISSLRSDIQIFLESERLPQYERSALQRSIVAELDELTQIVADVVDLARGTSLDGRLEPVELDLVVREAVDRAQRRAPRLKWDVELDPTGIVNAPDRVSRAVANVIDNARKWSEPGGEIEVRLCDGTLSVRDHGPGFDARDLPHVFERFYRAGSARGRPGSGLGLAIVRQAAEAYGGSAQAANAPGGGALLTVSFGPWSPEPATDAGGAATDAMPGGG